MPYVLFMKDPPGGRRDIFVFFFGRWGQSNILNVFDNACLMIRGLFGWPEKSLWSTKYDKLISLVTPKTFVRHLLNPINPNPAISAHVVFPPSDGRFSKNVQIWTLQKV